jgi:hypothetical protein
LALDRIKKVLTSAILEEVHSARAYLPWVKGLIEMLKQQPDGVEHIRLQRGLAKELLNEAFPLGIFASRYFANSDEVQIGLRVGNQPFDATIEDKRTGGTSLAYAEVTMAHEGEIEYLRMRHLHEKGSSHRFGKVIKSGTKKTGLNVTIEPEAVSQSAVLAQERALLSQALERKMGKPYQDNTVLIVGFDDIMAHDRADNIANLESTLETHLGGLKAFHSVAVVGLLNNLFIYRRIQNAI